MKKPRLTLLLTLCVAISIEGCAFTAPSTEIAAKPVATKAFCDKVPVPPAFPETAQIDINPTRVLYDEGGLTVLQNYAATREALQAACGK